MKGNEDDMHLEEIVIFIVYSLYKYACIYSIKENQGKNKYDYIFLFHVRISMIESIRIKINYKINSFSDISFFFLRHFLFIFKKRKKKTYLHLKTGV